MNDEPEFFYVSMPESALNLDTLSAVTMCFYDRGLPPQTRIRIERDVVFGQVPRVTFNELPPLPVIDGEIVAS